MADSIYVRRNDDGSINIEATAEAYWRVRAEKRCVLCGAPGFPVCSSHGDYDLLDGFA